MIMRESKQSKSFPAVGCGIQKCQTMCQDYNFASGIVEDVR